MMAINPIGKWIGGVALVTVLTLLLAACGADPTATPRPTATPTATPLPQAEPTATPDPAVVFQAEWDELIAAAQAEGELVALFGGGPTRAYRPVIEHFGELFGIKTIVSGGSSSDVANRILAERDNGRYTADVMQFGVTGMRRRMIPAGAVEPIEQFFVHPDVLDKSKWYKNKYWWADVEQKFAFSYSARPSRGLVETFWYNTNLVSEDEIKTIQTMQDVLDPKWKGKMVTAVIFSRCPGSAFNAYVNPEMGPEWMKTYLLEHDVFFSDDLRSVADGLARGKFHLGMFLANVTDALEIMASQGLPVKEYTGGDAHNGYVTGTSSSNTIAAINRPPHPNAAKLYINWWLSQEGQTAMQALGEGARVSQSLRVDVPQGNVRDDRLRLPDVDYVASPTFDPEALKLFDESCVVAKELDAQRKLQASGG